MISKIKIAGRRHVNIKNAWLVMLCFLHFQILIGMFLSKAIANTKLPKMAIIDPQIPSRLVPPLSHSQLASEPTPSNNIVYDNEMQCVVINKIELHNLYIFPNATRLKERTLAAHGRCLGEQGLSVLVANVQEQLVLDGYITSRVILADKSDADGTLYLKLIPGRIDDIRHHPDSVGKVPLNTIFPRESGDLVNLRHLEQGLENLQRLPSVNATMDIELNREDLSSQIVVNRQQSRLWRVNAYLDDAGHYTVGRYRAGLILFLDNPLSLSDLFYYSASRDIDSQHDKGYANHALHYSVPYGNWLLSITGSEGDRYQSLSFSGDTFKYRSHWKALDAQIQRLLTRGINYKAIVYTGAIVRQSASFFADYELEVQRVSTTDWQLGVEHLHYMPWATFRGGVRYQQGASWFGARHVPGNAGMEPVKLVGITGSLDVPFTLGKQSFHYRPAFRHQYTYSDIILQDRFSIGGRNSVRGFSGSHALVGSQGWYLKNDVTWTHPTRAQQFYIGMDYGEVSEKGHAFLLDDHLAGAVLGVRGNYYLFGYDFNMGIPIAKPADFHADPLVFGFTLTLQY